MTPATAPHLSGPISSARPQWLRAALRHLQFYVPLWAWLWALVAVAIAVAVVVINAVGTVDMSIAQFARNGPLIWFLFSISIIVSTTHLTAHVANGMTRRSFGWGAIAAVVVNGALNGATAAVIILVEGAVFDAMGWQHDLLAGSEYSPGIWEQGPAALLLDHSLVAIAGGVSGLLVGVTYYRLGGWLGTLSLPLTLLPVLGLLFVTAWSSDWIGWRIGEGVGAIVAVLLVLAGALAFKLLLRRIPIVRMEN